MTPIPTVRGRLIGALLYIAFAVGAPVTANPPQQVYALQSRMVEDLFCQEATTCWVSVVNDPANIAPNSWYIARTNDGGLSWNAWQPNVPIAKMFFLTSEIGWGFSNDQSRSLLAKTTNGGMTWTKLPSGAIPQNGRNTLLTSLGFGDINMGWLVGEQPMGLSFVLQFREGEGRTGIVAELTGKSGISRTIFVRPRHGIWISGNSSIEFSKDEGHTWEQQLRPEELPGDLRFLTIQDVWVDDNGDGFAVGGDGYGVVLKTKDFGEHWEFDFHGTETSTTSFTSISPRVGHQICVVGYSTAVYCSLGEGKDWAKRGNLPDIKRPAGSDLPPYTKIALVADGLHGLALNSNGSLYRTADAGKTWTQVDPLNLP